MNRFIKSASVQPRAGDKLLAADETRLELAVVILINVVLWTMVATAIYGFVQQLMAPKIGIYPIVAFLQIAAA